MAQQPQLPPFRIRQLHREPPRPSTSDSPNGSLIRMRRKSYDELLARIPTAALGYVDDDDGTHVTVGSSFELLQRLQEPFYPAVEQWNQSHDRRVGSIHAFDISDTQDVTKAWQPYTDRDLSQSQQQIPHNGLKTSAPPQNQDGASISSAPSFTNSPPSPHSGSLTPAGRRQIQEAAATLSRVSKHVEPLSSQERIGMAPHVSRWAAYSALPASFNQPSPPPEPKLPPRPGRSAVPIDPQEQKPLLALFEAELAKLAATPTGQDKRSDGKGATATREVGKKMNMQTARIPGNTPEMQSDSPQDKHLKLVNLHRQKARNLLAELSSFLEEDVGPTPLSKSADTHPVDRKGDSAGDARPEQAVPPNVMDSEVLTSLVAGTDIQQCSSKCMDGCSREACPVRSAVKTAYERAFPIGSGSNKRSPGVPIHYKVDCLIARRYIAYDSLVGIRKKQYLVRWLGHGPDKDVWYDAESLMHCDELIRQFDLFNPEPYAAASVPPMLAHTSDWMYQVSLLHSRAADRMITFQSDAYKHAPQASPRPPLAETSYSKNMVAPQLSGPIAREKPLSHSASHRDKPKPIWAETKKELRHRRSWHPLSKESRLEQDASSFDFSPVDVMKKYPPVSQIDAENSRKIATIATRIKKTTASPIKLSDELPAKAVKFSTDDLPDSRATLSRPYNQPDPTLYAPPSPVMPISKRLSTNDMPPSSVKVDAPSLSVRRVKSLSLRPASGTHPEERGLHHRERYQPSSESQSQLQGTKSYTSGVSAQRFAPFASLNAESSLRRAHTTATAVASAGNRNGRSHDSQRSPRNEADTRRDNVAHCTYRLAEMGFTRDQAAPVSEAVSGDLESALDLLNEDRRAQDEIQKKWGRRTSWDGNNRMPGAYYWGA